jgi:hypothetical protein
MITARLHAASVTLVFFSLDNRTAMLSCMRRMGKTGYLLGQSMHTSAVALRLHSLLRSGTWRPTQCKLGLNQRCPINIICLCVLVFMRTCVRVLRNEPYSRVSSALLESVLCRRVLNKRTAKKMRHWENLETLETSDQCDSEESAGQSQ